MKFRVAVTRYGFIDIEAESVQDAIEIVDDAEAKDFDWGEWGDPEVIDAFED